ncbi:DUF2877 domain-containing protein [Nocardioides sp. WL0053]|uniref:DUF2877 domain-containing protein n=1 Tax=Nocardioides jiangsuensis TaxID=2866161 RepID=A0ABS7RMK9_9ACTN|nr:DUF2877 domain-containing protein [Nocardioides jiangsuensis]MBY9076261.1 DUF2877 domain-containing protein [Nocardioides jiangsuensis]
MPSPDFPSAASCLLDALLDGPPAPLTEVARTRLSVHYATGSGQVPVLCVCTPDAVRLPHSLVTPALPPAGSATVGAGVLRVGTAAWRPVRWWRPDRPRGMRPPVHDLRPLLRDAADRCGDPGVTLPAPRYDGLDPATLLGAGPGLTPSGDDVVAGALVAAHATGDPRHAGWAGATRAALTATRTTPVSRGMLHHAADGYATPQLAGFVTAVCTGRDVDTATQRLLAVGHSSGVALLAGVVHTLTTYQLEGAA